MDGSLHRSWDQNLLACLYPDPCVCSVPPRAVLLHCVLLHVCCCRPDQVKKLMKEQMEVDESYSVLRVSGGGFSAGGMQSWDCSLQLCDLGVGCPVWRPAALRLVLFGVVLAV